MLSQVFVPASRTSTQIENQILTATGTTARISVLPGSVLRLVNTHATQTLHINFGTDAVAAVVANDMIIPPGSGVHFVQVPPRATSMAYIASGAGTIFHITQGQ